MLIRKVKMSILESVIKYLPYVGLAGLGVYLASKNSIFDETPREYFHAGELVNVSPSSELGKQIGEMDRQEEINIIKSCEAEIKAGRVTKSEIIKNLQIYQMLYYESGRDFKLLNIYMDKLKKN